MTKKFATTSPWYSTPMRPGYLGVLSIRPVSAEPDDILYTIDPPYNFRPDLLSYDLYGTPKLWWVFAQRNMDVIRDPVFDFVAGTQIFVPKKNSLFRVLGI